MIYINNNDNNVYFVILTRNKIDYGKIILE